MQKILSSEEINKFKKDGAIFLKGKFDKTWIKKLQKGIERDIKKPSPRFKSHTVEKGIPAYLEDYWTWDIVSELELKKRKREERKAYLQSIADED